MMTTPEHFRRRQLVEGVVVLLLAIFTVAQTISFSLSDRNQRDCFEAKFSDLSVALDARAELVERESDATRAVMMVFAEYAGLAKGGDVDQVTPAQQRELRRDFIATLVHYRKELNEVSRIRRENPVPPYPVGSCDGEG